MAHRDLIETGTEAEFFVSGIVKSDPLPGGNRRVYFASDRGRSCDRIEFTAIMHHSTAKEIARQLLSQFADQPAMLAHDGDRWATITEH